ncbi:cytochrome d ubiquinol oxidase subunit II [Endozoicomonas sp. SM1973]|uniref:Cytochrome d ubiquinol oxidase subunit II n=1 Tax=Spartinivicinus marinus TaxID=2994442 RepID=A0A853I6T3_9GAMM|nr:cytochrome d ubiquinol oxidase subunit II [Spartinivicinus marinus]MCX4027450.1 cytochrome d ubiquinol oxidase subunit II [Spartinivicinus marinus]NYZ66378.1 cytochrome d ubiquinol oxidase subunit II [Spartinivicinus marinus]
MDLAVVWLLVIVFGIFVYAILDGFDLGIGILYPWLNKQERMTALHSIKHVWDGNETWMVFAGVCLLVAFPKVYSQVLGTLYIPVFLMLFALIFRGVVFEYRFKADSSKVWWDFSFFAGSTIAAFSQGTILGSVLLGLQTNSEQLTPLWLHPFSLAMGALITIAYCTLGSLWLQINTEPMLEKKCNRIANKMIGLFSLLSLIVVYSFFGNFSWAETAFILSFISYKWMAILVVGLFCFLTMNSNISIHTSSKKVFLLFCSYLLVLYLGLLNLVFPYIIPGQLTIWQAMGNENSLQFALVGVAILLPVVLAYTVYSYKVFSGKPDSSINAY